MFKQKQQKPDIRGLLAQLLTIMKYRLVKVESVEVNSSQFDPYYPSLRPAGLPDGIVLNQYYVIQRQRYWFDEWTDMDKLKFANEKLAQDMYRHVVRLGGMKKFTDISVQAMLNVSVGA